MTIFERPGKNADAFMIRFPEGMRDLIKARAERLGVSMNIAILQVLQAEFVDDSVGLDDLERARMYLDRAIARRVK